MNNQQRFELLSAYLDRELRSDQVEQVEQWLKRDPEAQKLYQNLLQLRYRLRETAVPSSHSSQEQLADTVVAKANYQTWKQVLLWGGGTVAAVFIAIISGNNSPMPRLAQSISGNNSSISGLTQSSESDMASDSLRIALNQPVLEMPAAPASNASNQSEQGF